MEPNPPDVKRTDSQRSRTMAAVKSRDTGPERRVAAELDQLGVGYRQNVADLPGKPDFVVGVEGKQPLAIFVHGCWWHGHDCPRGARTPKTNREYWLAKVSRNRRRDRRVARQLRAGGYSVWVVWECGLKRRGLPPKLRAVLQPLGRLADDC